MCVCVCGGGRFRWGTSFLSGDVPLVGDLVLMGGFSKKNQDGGGTPQATPPPTPTLWETLILSIFANIQVGKHAEYCISSNKGHPLISAASSVIGDFLEIFSKVFRTAMLKSNHMQWVCNGYSRRNKWVTQRLNKECFKFSNKYIKFSNLKLFSSPWGVWFGLLILKTIQNCIIVIFHLMCLTNPFFQPAGYSFGWHLLFHNWCKAIKWSFLISVPKSATKMYVCVKGFFYGKYNFHHSWVIFPTTLNSNFVKWKLTFTLV